MEEEFKSEESGESPWKQKREPRFTKGEHESSVRKQKVSESNENVNNRHLSNN